MAADPRAALEQQKMMLEAQKLRRKQMLDAIKFQNDQFIAQTEFQAQTQDVAQQFRLKRAEQQLKEREKAQQLQAKGAQAAREQANAPVLDAPQRMDMTQPRPDMETMGGVDANSMALAQGGPPQGSGTAPGSYTPNSVQSGQFTAPDYLRRVVLEEGTRGVGMNAFPESTSRMEIEENKLTAAQAARLNLQDQQFQYERQDMDRRFGLDRNKIVQQVTLDILKETNDPRIAHQVGLAVAAGDVALAEQALAKLGPTASYQLAKARTNQAFAAAGASRASAVSSYASAAKSGQELQNLRDKAREDRLAPFVTAAASPLADPEQVSGMLLRLSPEDREFVLDRATAQRATPQSTVGKTLYDVGMSPRDFTPEERKALVDDASKKGQVNVSINPQNSVLAEVQKQQIVIANSRSRLERATRNLRKDYLGAKARGIASLVAFSTDKAGLVPILPDIADVAARAMSRQSPRELREWYKGYSQTLATVGRDTAEAIHDLYGANLTGREDKRAQQFLPDLESGDPVRIQAVIGDALLYSNMRLAGYKIWQRSQQAGGNPGQNPWDVTDAKVAQTIFEAHANTAQLMASRPEFQGRSKREIALLAMRQVEEELTLSPGFGNAILQEYGYGK